MNSKRRGINTVRQYNQAYKILNDVIEPTEFCSAITKDTVNQFINFLKNRNYEIRNSTINTYLRLIRAFIYYLIYEGLTQEFKVKLLAENRIPKIIPTEFELSLLLQKPNLKTCNFSEFRNWVLVNYFLTTGNRLRTVINIKLRDLDFRNQLIHLTTLKCNNPYIIPIYDTIMVIKNSNLSL